MIRALLIALSLIAAAGAAKAQSSNAARYLAKQNISEACNGGAGDFRPGALIEADLDMDGRNDLIVVHEGIRCTGGTTAYGHSAMCGMQVCSVRIYLRRGDLLQLQSDFLGGGVAVNQATTPPVISGYAHGGDTWAIRWTGDRFR